MERAKRKEEGGDGERKKGRKRRGERAFFACKLPSQRPLPSTLKQQTPIDTRLRRISIKSEQHEIKIESIHSHLLHLIPLPPRQSMHLQPTIQNLLPIFHSLLRKEFHPLLDLTVDDKFRLPRGPITHPHHHSDDALHREIRVRRRRASSERFRKSEETRLFKDGDGRCPGGADLAKTRPG